MKKSIAIIGSGNIGVAIAQGLVYSKAIEANQITLTARHKKKINHLSWLGMKFISIVFQTTLI